MKRRNSLKPIIIESPYNTFLKTLNWCSNKIKNKSYEVQIFIGIRDKRNPIIAIVTQFKKDKVSYKSDIYNWLYKRGVKTAYSLHNHPFAASYPSVGDLSSQVISKHYARHYGVELRNSYVTSTNQRLLSYKRGYQLASKEDKEYYSTLTNAEIPQ